jgi:hypothetical protein
MISESTTLATRQTIAELVDVIDKARADITRAFGLLDDAERTLNLALGNDEEWRQLRLKNDVHHSRGFDWSRPDTTLTMLERDLWTKIVERLEVRSILSVERAQQLDKQLDEGDMPELTLENVVGLAAGFRSQMGDMLEEAVKEVFEWLRPRGWADRYKTNSQFEVPKKVILPCIVEHGINGLHVRYASHSYDVPARLTALENVFSSLDGKRAATGTYRSELQNLIDTGNFEGSTAYFGFRVFGNGNMHLTFHRSDLLAKLNQKAGGKALRGERKPRSM